MCASQEMPAIRNATIEPWVTRICRALRPSGGLKRADRVGDRLDAGQRRSAVGEGLRQHVDQPDADQALGAVPERVDRARVLAHHRQPAAEHLAVQPDDDHRRHGNREQVGGQRERPARLADAAQVDVTHDQHGDHGDEDQDVRPDHRDVRQLRERGDDGGAARGGLHGDGHRVVDEQRHRRDLGDPRPEVLPGHDVGAAGPGVDGDDLAVGEHDQRDAGQHDQRHRQDQRERRQADHLDHLDQHLFGAVRGRRDAVAGEHAEGERPGQPLLGKLLVDERRAEKPPFERVAERLRQPGAGQAEASCLVGH